MSLCGDTMIQIENANELATNELSDLYIIQGLLPHKAISMLYGGDGQGKTTALLGQVSLALTQQKMFDRDCKINKILYISGEGNMFLPYTIKALTSHYGDLSGLDIIRDDNSDILLYDEQFMSVLSDKIAEVTEFGYKYDLVIFDNLQCFLGEANESSASDTAILKRNLKKLTNALDCGVLLIHHSQKMKNGDEGETAKDVRGSSGLTGMCDVVMFVHSHAIHCRKVRNGHGFDAIPFRVETVMGTKIGTFPTGMVVKEMPKQDLDLCIEQLRANPKLSMIALTRLVWSEKATGTTPRQKEIIRKAMEIVNGDNAYTQVTIDNGITIPATYTYNDNYTASDISFSEMRDLGIDVSEFS